MVTKKKTTTKSSKGSKQRVSTNKTTLKFKTNDIIKLYFSKSISKLEFKGNTLHYINIFHNKVAGKLTKIKLKNVPKSLSEDIAKYCFKKLFKNKKELTITELKKIYFTSNAFYEDNINDFVKKYVNKLLKLNNLTPAKLRKENPKAYDEIISFVEAAIFMSFVILVEEVLYDRYLLVYKEKVPSLKDVYRKQFVGYT